MTDFTTRRHERFRSANLIHYTILDETGVATAQGMGKTLDVSLGGILIETSEALDPGAAVSIGIGLKDALAQVQGVIAHTAPETDGKFKVGVRFGDLEPGSVSILEQFISAFLEQAGK